MRTKIYLVCDRYKVLRICKRNPSLRQNERAIALTLDVPNSVFNVPVMSASVAIPEANVLGQISVKSEAV